MPHRTGSMTRRALRAFLVVLAFQLVAAPSAMGLTGRRCPLFDNPEYLVGAKPLSIASGDLDGDGDGDLVTANFLNATISVLLNHGDGAFADPVTYRIGWDGGNFEPASVAIGDWNGDGPLDVVVPNRGSDNVSILFNRSDDCNEALGDLDGDGSVGASNLLILLANWGSCDACEACTADLDGNCTVGASDLLILLANWG